MEKRVLLAVVLSFIVLYGYQALFPPPEPPQARRRAVAGRTAAPPVPDRGRQSASPAGGAGAGPRPHRSLSDTAERDITFENDVGAARCSRRAAVRSRAGG